MNIGEASKASSVSAKMIRYYEQIGLIPAADRTESGYRAYSQADIHRLRFIRRARDLGFQVAEITDLLGLWNDTSRHSADVKRLAEQHIVDLEQRIENMRQMADTLKSLISCCAGDDRPECPILQRLVEDDEIQSPVDAPKTGAVRRRAHKH
ncbi:MAG: Cu(I)-responsive transcriptional regulator [Stenotrophomonas sp.]